MYGNMFGMQNMQMGGMMNNANYNMNYQNMGIGMGVNSIPM